MQDGSCLKNVCVTVYVCVFGNEEPYWNYKVIQVEFSDPNWNVARIHEGLLFSLHFDNELFNKVQVLTLGWWLDLQHEKERNEYYPKHLHRVLNENY